LSDNPPNVPNEPHPPSGVPEPAAEGIARKTAFETFLALMGKKSEADPQFEISGGGVDRKDAIRKEFDKLLMAAATISMHRRQSHTMDESDFTNGYQHLLASRQTPWVRIIVGNLAGLLAAAAVGIGSNFATGNDHVGPGLVLIATGLILGIIAVLFQHLPTR
jgi:hypothetical protein